METKVCSVCKANKSLSDFYTNKNAKSGYYSFCKSCYKDKEDYRKIHGTAKLKRELDTNTEKYCSNCKKVKPLAEFIGTRFEGKRTTKCKKCLGDVAVRRQGLTSKHSANMKSILVRYKITEEILQDLLLKQQGCCKICGCDFGSKLASHNGRQYHIDHDHITGEVRGLLCAPCNRTLGNIEKLDLYKIKDYLGL